MVETDIAGVRADALIIVIAAREPQLEVVNERDVVVGANDGQHEFAEDALRREVPFRRIADARSAGRISDKNAVDERRSEEHTSELQSLMRNSYAVFCLNKNTQPDTPQQRRSYENNT